MLTAPNPATRKENSSDARPGQLLGRRQITGETTFRYRDLNASEKSIVVSVITCMVTTIYWELIGNTSIANIGSFNLTALEFVFATSFFAVGFNIINIINRFKIYTIVSGALLLIMMINVCRGMFVDPIESLTAVRKTGSLAFFILLAPALAFSDRLKYYVVKAVTVTSIALSSLIIFRRTTGLLWTDIALSDGRPILAMGGFIIVLGCIISLSQAFGVRNTFHSMAIFFLSYVSIIWSGQGTGNLCALVGIAIILALEPGASRSLRLILAGGIAAAAIAILVIAPQIFSLNTLSGTGSSAFDAFLAERNGTNETRQLVWKGLWVSYQRWTELEKILGLPSGVKPVIWIPLWNGTYWKFGMHSMYLQTLVLQGMLGLILYVLLFVSLSFTALWRALVTVRQVDGPISPAAGVAILVALALFGYSYDLGGEMAPYLMLGFGGVLVSGGRLPLRARARSRTFASNPAR